MGKPKGPWQDGRRAWERLAGWYQDDRPTPAGQQDDGDLALKALSDVGRLRHLLDQAELVAVRTARRHGKSWAEVAVRLGVTRQSAWQRWRDLDEEAGAQLPDARSQRDVALEVESGAAAEYIAHAARELRRHSSVRVPNVVGMSWDDARQVLHDRRLVAVGPDPDGPPLAALGWPDGVVTDQSPESGAKVPVGSPVTLWFERGGGSAGVREPRRPKPTPRAARAMRDERSDQVSG